MLSSGPEESITNIWATWVPWGLKGSLCFYSEHVPDGRRWGLRTLIKEDQTTLVPQNVAQYDPLGFQSPVDVYIDPTNNTEEHSVETKAVRSSLISLTRTAFIGNCPELHRLTVCRWASKLTDCVHSHFVVSKTWVSFMKLLTLSQLELLASLCLAGWYRRPMRKIEARRAKVVYWLSSRNLLHTRSWEDWGSCTEHCRRDSEAATCETLGSLPWQRNQCLYPGKGTNTNKAVCQQALETWTRLVEVSLPVHQASLVGEIPGHVHVLLS